MATKNTGASRRGGNLGRKSKNTFTTKSGQTIKINRSIGDRIRAYRASGSQKRAERLSGMPKGRVHRFFYRLHPKRMYKYWFSREGGIMALKVFGISALVGFILLVGLFAYFRKDLRAITDVSGNNIGGSIEYYDRTGKVLLWEDFDAVKRIPVAEDQISDNIKKATVAIEDKDFFKHGGFDVRGIARAGLSNVFGTSNTKQGGSTITQQLVRLTQPDVGKEQTYARKIKELILAVQLEREFNKNQILAYYLNTAPYGNIEYGVQAGANDYFHKDAKDLTIEEAAMLAAIPKSPSLYSPYGPYYDSQALVDRKNYIIDQMVEQNMITREDADKAKQVNVLKKVKKQSAKYAGIKAPYFALAAKDEIESKYGATTANRGGWKVITTVDMKLQKLAEESVMNSATARSYGGADTAGFVAEDVKTGQIVALVGGVDFNNKDYGKINYAHDVYIAPGSSFKPYDYAALVEYKNAGAGSVLYDQQGALPGYPCTKKGLPPPRGDSNCLQNYDFRYPGPLTLRYALGGSRNIPAVKANLIVGTDQVIDMASRMMANEEDKKNNRQSYNCFETGADLSPSADIGELFSQRTQCYGASAIGDGAFLHLDDHVNGLSTLSRLGNAIPRTYIMKITDGSGKTLTEFKQPKGEQVIRPESAYIVNDMASDPNASYLPYGYKFHNYKGWKFAVKTGTTNNGYDGLMASWSSKYAAVSWVGYHTRNQELRGAMEYMTTPITRMWMEGAHDGAGNAVNWEKPSSVKTAPAYVVRSHVGIGSVEPSPSQDIYPEGNQQNKTAVNKKLDIVSNKLATECTPQRAIKSGGSSSNTFSVDEFVDAASGNTSEKDDVHKCSDEKPTITLLEDSVNCNSSCTISANITKGTHPLSSSRFPGTVNFYVDGKLVGSKQVSSSGTVDFTYKPTFTGSKSMKVEIIDSVLYDNSDSGTITATGGGTGGLSINTPSDGSTVNGNETNVSWSNGSGSYTLYVDSPAVGGYTVACNTSSSSCKISTLLGGQYKIYVKDDDETSSTVTFSK